MGSENAHPAPPSTSEDIKAAEPPYKITLKITPKITPKDNYNKEKNEQNNKVNEAVNCKLKDKVESDPDNKVYYEKDGKSYWGIPIKKFKYNYDMFEEIRIGSNKPHFSVSRIHGLFKYITNNNPEKLITGGINGFKKYLINIVNAEIEEEDDYIEDDPNNASILVIRVVPGEATLSLEERAIMKNKEALEWCKAGKIRHIA